MRWRGSRAQSAERATHTERWLHLPGPVFFPCHTHLGCTACAANVTYMPSVHVVDANRQSIEEERSISSGERGEGCAPSSSTGAKASGRDGGRTRRNMPRAQPNPEPYRIHHTTTTTIDDGLSHRVPFPALLAQVRSVTH